MGRDIPEFLNEVTLRICSSLEVKTALNQTFEYLKEFFPVYECFFQMFDTGLGAVRNIAYISVDKDIIPTARSIIPMTKEIWEWSFNQDIPYLVHKKSQDKLARSLAEAVGLNDNQDLVLPLRIGGKPLGVLVLRAFDQETFTPYHMELINVIKAPLSIAMSNALAHEATVRLKDLLLDDNSFLKNELQSELPKDIIGTEGGLRHIMEMVRQVAPLSNIVLLLGETGVGKEVIANAVHYSSFRSKNPFIKVNCGAIPESLLDSELFGHEEGAFTGALAKKRGRFERAHTGTLFLDEIGELPLAAQVRLLRVIQHHEIERIGSSETISIDVRVIAATHRNLGEMISENKFREDLWFRLNVFPIVIPPLRQRREDIPELAIYFIDRKCKKIGITTSPALAPGALDRLESYHWPGNVRELENVIERELIRHPSGPLTFKELLSLDRNVPAKTRSSNIIQVQQPLDDVITTHIQNVLKLVGGKVSGPGGAAEILEINESTLRARMRKLGISHGSKKR